MDQDSGLEFIDPRGKHIYPKDFVVVTPYGSGDPIKASFRFGIVEKLKPFRSQWGGNADICVKFLTFNTMDQTFSITQTSMFHHHNRRVFKVTRDNMGVLSDVIVQLIKMMKGKIDE